MLKYLYLFTALHCFGFLNAQTTYEVTFPNPNSHYADVSALFQGVQKDSVDIKMPVWTPGSYMVREYSRNVETFEAFDETGKELKVVKVRKNIWRVYHGFSSSVTCNYKVYANELNVRSCFVDADQAYINGVGMYMYTESLKDTTHIVHFRPDTSWNKISSGLKKNESSQWVRIAADYDELVDAPTVLGKHTVFSFDYNGIPHEIAMIGEAKFDSVKIKKDFYRIVDECTRIFGDNPNKSYTFLIHNTPAGGGGLEHRNSCSIMTARSNYENEEGYKGLLSLVAHEYFHLWIVKRVRPLELGPFDYDNEVYTRQLWFFEGFTSFYDDYIVYRAGFTSEKDYLEIVKSNIQTLINTPGDKVQPVSEASFDAWIKYYRRNENSRNATVSYYTKGSLLAVVLYLDFLNNTGGRQTLDTLMNFLYNGHYKKLGRGLSDNELQEYFESVGAHDYDDFFNRYIHGTDEIPFEKYLNMAGLELKRTDGMKKQSGYLGAVLHASGNRLIVSEVQRNSPSWTNGLSVNDEIISIDNHEGPRALEYLTGTEPGTTVKIKLLRSGLPRDAHIKLGEPVEKEFIIDYAAKPSEMQLKVRKGWLVRKK